MSLWVSTLSLIGRLFFQLVGRWAAGGEVDAARQREEQERAAAHQNRVAVFAPPMHAAEGEVLSVQKQIWV